ncbi:type IV pilin [Methanoculleus sp. Afa-1]|uniref:Type IV pilin n=2 Tax=Methanoculleus formosensis TaxID=2590886 RepID=A0A9E4ZKN8_9EURY|nr:type IV pilin [Methanoculleus sp. Afa-1]
MNFKQNEEAVSPVIGVILMVAITVILAAVIAAFVFGMAGNVGTTKNVAATATQVGNDIIITYQGGPDHNAVMNLTVIGSDGVTYYYDNEPPTNLVAAIDSTVKPTVGATMKLVDNGTTSKDHIVAAAIFDDGTTQVILDTNL